MRFAYLVMAHNEMYVLKHLIRMLDYPENDIYVHIDTKSRTINKDDLITKKARIFYKIT